MEGKISEGQFRAQSKRAEDALNDALLALEAVREKSGTAAIEALMLAARLCRELESPDVVEIQ